VEAHAGRAATAPVLPDRAVDPAGFLLAAADIREGRIAAATAGAWEAFCPGSEGWEVREVVPPTVRRRRRIIAKLRGGTFQQDRADAEHIAAEANPALARGEVALWREIVGMLHHEQCFGISDPCSCIRGILLRKALGAARAYLTGAGE
jgi:hypothetical protein